MLHFVVVVTKDPGAGVSPDLVTMLDAGVCSSMPTAVQHVHCSLGTGRTHFAGWSDDPADPPWTSTPTGVAAYGGHPLIVADRVPGSALDWIEAAPRLAERAEEVDGVFTLLRIHADGSGELVNDQFGVHTLYVTDTPSATIIGNRSELVAGAVEAQTGTAPSTDDEALAIVVLLGNMIGEASGYRGISTLPFGSGAVIEPSGIVRISKRSKDPWERGSEGPEPLTDEMVDAVEDRMIRVIHAVLEQNRGEQPLAELTAGKDSRLVLAMLTRAGVTDDIRFFTRGSERTPDFEGAAAIAERLGLDFVRAWWPMPLGGYRSFNEEHVRRTGGELGSWESSESRRHVAPTFSGLFGETIRLAFPRFADIDDADVLRRRFERLLRNRSGPLRPEALDRAVEATLDLLFEPLADGASTDELADIYFVKHRQRRWVGSLMDRHVMHFYPLYATGLSATAFRLGHDARRDDVLRQALMRRAGLDLGDLAFAKADKSVVQTQGEATPEASYPIVDLRPPLPADENVYDLSPADFAEPASRADALAESAARNRDVRAFEMIDRDAFEGAIGRYDDLTTADQVKLHKALTAVLWQEMVDR